MASTDEEDNLNTSSEIFRYLIVRPENGGVRDLFRFMVSADRASGAKFLESSDDDNDDVVLEELFGSPWDHRWVILVSIVARKVIALVGKPMEWIGCLVEFFLNLLSLNDNLLGLLINLLHGKVVMPRRGSETFISAIGHLDGRIDLCNKGTDETLFGQRSIRAELGDRGLMDLCMMASKLAYENANVVRNVVNLHWKMEFVDFYNCWNDFQKEMSTQVFLLCDKPKDANLILISFRGTEPFDADDWSTDFDYSWYEIPKLGKVHMGFLEALGLGNRANVATFQKLLQLNKTNTASSTVLSSEGSESLSSSSDSVGPPGILEINAYYAVKSKLESLLEEHKNAKFVVTGHSLGGALAILFPTVLLLHEEKEIMERLLGVYTFGQPRVGNSELVTFMKAHLCQPVPKYFRVVYCNDLVPRLPYDDKTFLYKHFGTCLYYNSLYIEQKVDEEPNRNYFGLRYLIPEYLNAVWELMRSLMIGYVKGPEYKESWLSILLRIVGLGIPGIAAHSPTDYVNSVRLGRESTIQMSSI